MSAALKYKPRKKLAIHRLPFVGRVHVQPEHGGLSFWDVPLTGGYIGGCKAGEALAVSTLVFLREERDSHYLERGILGQIAAAWMERAIDANPEERLALRGQAVGFMSKMSEWVDAAVSDLGANLDRSDKAAILTRINAGLALDEEAFLARLTG